MHCTCLMAPLAHSAGCPTRLRQRDVALQPASDDVEFPPAAPAPGWELDRPLRQKILAATRAGVAIDRPRGADDVTSDEGRVMTTTGPGVHPEIADLAVDIDTVRPYNRNPRRHDLSVIRESLQENGQYRPLVVNRGTVTGRVNEILAGSGTWQVAKDEGWWKVAVTFVDVDEDRAAKIVLVDNRANQLGGFDDAILAELLTELDDVSGTGYTEPDLDDLLASVEEADSGTVAALAPAADSREGTPFDGPGPATSADRSTRSLSLVYPLDQYAWVVKHLQTICDEHGMESNSDALVWLLEQATGDTKPSEDAAT